VKAKVTVATGEQSWLGRLFSVDALNMPERFDAGSGGAVARVYSDSTGQRSRQCAADGLVLATHIRWFPDGVYRRVLAK
jgi:hypothetical protein